MDQTTQPRQPPPPQPETYVPAQQKDAIAEPVPIYAQRREQPQSQTARHVQQNPPSEPVQTQTYNLPPQKPYSMNQQQAPVNQPPYPSSQPTQPQQQSFLGRDEPAGPFGSPARHNTAYGDWFAPTAAGVAGAGVGAMGAEAYCKHEQRQPSSLGQPLEPMPEPAPAPAPFVPSESGRGEEGPAQPTDSLLESIYNDVVTPLEPSVGSGSGTAPFAMPASSGDEHLGGLESEGARETGRIFPIVRHDTDMSVSALHVPGEFPKKAGGRGGSGL